MCGPAQRPEAPRPCGGCIAQERWQGACNEQAAPARERIKQKVSGCGEKIAARIARLQEARHEAAGAGRNRFHGERGPDAPFAAHGNAKCKPQKEKEGEVWSKGGEELEEREKQNVCNQRRAAPITVRNQAKEERAERPCRQGEGDRRGNRGQRGSKIAGGILKDEDEDKEVEGIEGPAKIARHCGAALSRGERQKSFDHAFPSSQGVRLEGGSGNSRRPRRYCPGHWRPPQAALRPHRAFSIRAAVGV